MTGTLSLLAPAMIAVAISTAVVGDRTIDSAQLLDRSQAPHHALRLSLPMLATLRVRDAVEHAPVLSGEMSVAEALEILSGSTGAAAVVDEAGRPLGVVERRGLERSGFDGGAMLASVVVPLVVDEEATLEQAMAASAEAGTHSVAVSQSDRLAGVVTANGILKAYRNARRTHANTPA